MKKIVSVLLALFVSLYIYVFYRSDKTLINEFIKLVFSPDYYSSLKSMVASALPLTNLIVYSLPGGLWVFSAVVFSQGFYVRIFNYKAWLAWVPILFAVGLELLQLVHVVHGTFDWWDVLLYILFWLMGYFGFPRHDRQQNIMTPFTLHGFICLACLLSVYLAHVTT